VLEATVRLVPWPRHRTLVVLGYPDIYTAADHIAEVMRVEPMACEALDDGLISNIKKKGLHPKYLEYLPQGKAFLLLEFGGDTGAEADERARGAIATLAPEGSGFHGKLYDDPDQEEKVWKIRESGLGATARVPGEPDTWPGWVDSAVPPDRMADYLRDLRKIYDAHGLEGAFYGHFGQGCLHSRISFDLTSKAGIANFRSFMNDATDLCVRYGGSLSGEHGDGQARAEFLPKMYGPDLVRAFREFKSIWDPTGRMNPGKVVDPYPVDDHLRLGEDFRSPSVKTAFAYPDDHGDFTRATLRCVGVGECRREGKGTMCPSYMATREEKHSTRGRAHLLFEMMRGQELDGWRDDSVRESLDLCLACKGCKGDCPVNVDVATYKAEFLSHYYQHRLRPVAAYSMGLIHWWARLAALAPGLVNLLTQAPLTSAVFKRLGGIAPKRQVPQFAARTFKSLWRERPARNVGKPDVMLWPDTFNDHFFPDTALAAAEVLEEAGFHVIVPSEDVCCGRPLYDFGMVDTAKRVLRRTLTQLDDAITRGVPVVGLEPSCVSVFRDEMHSLFPDDPKAERLRKQTFLFSELIEGKAKGFEFPKLARKAVVHGHCHHKSLFGMDDERAFLGRLGLDFEIVDSGCCGMAGSFGFERGDKYEVSMKVGEQRLLPAVRRADDDALVIADGFSCREQIAQGSDREALHVAEVARMALHDGAMALPSHYPILGPARPAAAGAASLGALAFGVALRRRGRARGWPRLLTASGSLAALGIATLGALGLTALSLSERRRRARH
jgi:Fe-S oxidoreductase